MEMGSSGFVVHLVGLKITRRLRELSEVNQKSKRSPLVDPTANRTVVTSRLRRFAGGRPEQQVVVVSAASTAVWVGAPRNRVLQIWIKRAPGRQVKQQNVTQPPANSPDLSDSWKSSLKARLTLLHGSAAHLLLLTSISRPETTSSSSSSASAPSRVI